MTKEKYIHIKGAKQNNLNNLEVKIPKNKLTVITGVSGSGKSSLAFNTLFAEGQRKYIESLSSYARQFLGKLNKPKVDFIKNISPAIAVKQKVNTSNPRSTVGTITEIYDYLKLLYARVGSIYSPNTGNEIKKDTIQDVLQAISTYTEGEKLVLVVEPNFNIITDIKEWVNIQVNKGYARVLINNELVRLDNFPRSINGKSVYLVIDRIAVKHNDEDSTNRYAESIQNAFYEGNGKLKLFNLSTQTFSSFSNQLEEDGVEYIEPSVNLFTFNNPIGACPTCEGFGNTLGISEELVIPNKNLSVYEGAIVCWRGEKMSRYQQKLIDVANKFDFPIHKPIKELTSKQLEILWKGNKYYDGLDGFFKFLEEKSYKIQYRVMLARYRGKIKCPSCHGNRLRKEANYVQVGGKNISQLVDLSIENLFDFFKTIELTEYEKKVSKIILSELDNRLTTLLEVGLGYLHLNRASNTLSGGETQRINLSTALSSSLVGSLYVLDEPSIGLHARDTNNLISVLLKLKKLGNTVVVVEHDEEIIKAADYIIDIGPFAGKQGGNLTFSGDFDLFKNSDSLTAQYLFEKMNIPLPEEISNKNSYIELKGVSQHNLRNIDVKFPLNALTVVSGVSGSGKSTLVNHVLFPAISKHLGLGGIKPGEHTSLEGKLHHINHVEYVTQNPIGKSSRSNPVTYIKAYDEIRTLFSKQKLSKLNGYKQKHFSFNVEGGRCEVCKGDGKVQIEMQFLADVEMICEECEGNRFKKNILDVQFEGKNINDILSFTVDEALEFFTKHEVTKVVKKLLPLQEVGLGYIQLGQSSSDLSGGEAQRVKLAYYLAKVEDNGATLFIFDEPTTGLHFHDIEKLLTSFGRLIEEGHTVIVVEHNMDVIKCADYLIELGPDAGENGGNLVFQGKPKDILQIKNSPTAPFLKEKLI